MSLKTNNKYGQILIYDNAIYALIHKIVMDTYGVKELVSRNIKDSFLDLMHLVAYSKGIKISTNNSSIKIDVYCLIDEGVNQETVKTNLVKAIKYNVENYTGMIVEEVIVHVLGKQV
ncbi:MAG: Asp23/Gls24 family envelope stress response protein [Clostridia bacterium]|nr:Asp23/Gls24 family envelope stress response protein [Clostridia bacterium]